MGMLAIAALMTIAAPARAERRDERTDAPHVASFSVEAVDTLNARIDAATRAGAAWARDPLRIAIELCAGEPGSARRLAITFEAAGGETPDSATVVVVADGYLDDSVRGSWIRLRFARAAEAWHLTALHRALRCWRGDRGDVYASEPCP